MAMQGRRPTVYREYLDPEFRDRFDEYQRAAEELRAAMVNRDSALPRGVGGGDRATAG